MVITKEHLALARRLGACCERLSRYKVGQPVGEVYSGDLAWMEDKAPKEAAAMSAALCAEINISALAPIPLRMFGYGDGDGYGYGYGYGFGDGYGYGYGYGFGFGDGDGYGYGLQDGLQDGIAE